MLPLTRPTSFWAFAAGGVFPLNGVSWLSSTFSRISALETGCCATAADAANDVKAIRPRKSLCRGRIYLTRNLSRGRSPKRRIVNVSREQQIEAALVPGDLARIVPFVADTAISPIRIMDSYLC